MELLSRGWRAALVATAVALAPEGAHAQTPGDEAKARALFDEARKKADAGQWAEACPLFEQANQTFSTGGTMLQLANCDEQIGEIAKAYDLYLQILQNKANEKFPERLQIARDRVAELRKKLPPDTPAPPPPPAAPSSTAAAAPPPSAAPTAAPAATAEPASSGPSRAPAFAAFGVGAAGVAVGAVFGVLALSQRASVVDSCTAGVCPASQKSEADAARTKAWVSNVGFAVGIVGVGVGVVLLVARGGDAPKASALRADARGLVVGF